MLPVPFRLTRATSTVIDVTVLRTVGDHLPETHLQDRSAVHCNFKDGSVRGLTAYAIQMGDFI